MNSPTSPSTPLTDRRAGAGRLATAAAAMLGAAVFALDTWQHGWALPELVVGGLAVLAAVAAALGRAGGRPALAQAAPRIAGAALVAALVLFAFHRYV